jgi:hypothetical protein
MTITQEKSVYIFLVSIIVLLLTLIDISLVGLQYIHSLLFLAAMILFSMSIWILLEGEEQ